MKKPQRICYLLHNNNGLVVSFSNFGARIVSITYQGLEIARNGFVSGRCANRIANATFTLNGKEYQLDRNEGKNHLHGGRLGFAKKFWELKTQTKRSISFFLHSPDGDMGYPGNLDITVTYTLSENNELVVEFNAISGKDTVLNPISHLYIANPNGGFKLSIDASTYTEKGKDRIPTGRIISVNGTKYDFRSKNKLIANESYDVNYVLNGEGFRKVAFLENENLVVDLFTDRPGLQLYQTKKYVCLEAQMFPDAVHHPNFPSVVIKKDAAFYSKTAYHFNYFK